MKNDRKTENELQHKETEDTTKWMEGKRKENRTGKKNEAGKDQKNRVTGGGRGRGKGRGRMRERGGRRGRGMTRHGDTVRNEGRFPNHKS